MLTAFNNQTFHKAMLQHSAASATQDPNGDFLDQLSAESRERLARALEIAGTQTFISYIASKGGSKKLIERVGSLSATEMLAKVTEEELFEITKDALVQYMLILKRVFGEADNAGKGFGDAS
jgi:hypothetical protein